MKRGLILLALLVVVPALLAAPGQAAGPENFRAHLSGAEEVPPVDTKATGQSTFQLDTDATELRYRVTVANIEDVTQAHIHCGATGVNGPVVAFLFGPDADGTSPNGILAQGTLTDADVIPLADSAACPGGVANFAEMVDKIRSGNAYVNVHTQQWPGGEIRGQL